MLLRDLASKRDSSTLARCLAWTRTLEYRRLRDSAVRTIEDWRGRCARPVVSVSGGKDSTLLLSLCREIDPSIPAYRADPPNPLPDRPAFVRDLQLHAGGPWVVVPYPWDVEAVLDGRERYPAGLKVRRLLEAMRRDAVDGVALGIRAAESKARTMNFRARGRVYTPSDGITRCTPLVDWRAEQVIGALLAEDRLPLNPVYHRMSAAPDLERVRDGTWWPVGPDGRSWLAAHYPEVVQLYDRARAVSGVERRQTGRFLGVST